MSGHNDVTFAVSVIMPNIPWLKYKVNYPNVALVSVEDVSWCAVFRMGKILLTLFMLKLTFTPGSGRRLLKYIWW